MSLPTVLKSMAISEIMTEYPQTRTVFQQFGLQTYAQTETARHENLQASALVHSIDLEALVRELAQAIEN